MNEFITVSIEDHIAHVRLNRPTKRNAITGEILVALQDAAVEIAANKTVYAVVLSGEGQHFSAGIDTEYMLQMHSGDLNADSASVTDSVTQVSSSRANEVQQAAWAWQELPQPMPAYVPKVTPCPACWAQRISWRR